MDAVGGGIRDLFAAASRSVGNGEKDTVIVDANSITRVIVRFPMADELGFDPDATFARGSMADHSAHGEAGMGDLQGYVWHCHMLDHEDHDMMLRYRVVT